MDLDHIRNTVKVYDSVADMYHRQSIGHAPILEREKFCKLLKPQSFILDLGCGSGRDAKFFSQHGYHTFGIELSDKLLAIAKQHAPAAIIQKQDMRHLTFPPNRFDGIWACASLMHLRKRELPAVLTKLFTILKSPGVAFLHMKRGEGEGYKMEPSIPDQARYFSLYSEAEFERAVLDAGFQITEIATYNDKDRFPDSRPTEWISCFASKP